MLLWWGIMRSVFALLLLLLTASTGIAQDSRLSPDAYETYTRGYTIVFQQDGQIIGAEQYLSDRQVVWTFVDGNCTRGEWYVRNGAICFAYENSSDDPCWYADLVEGGLRVSFAQNPQIQQFEKYKSTQPIQCANTYLGS